MGLSDGERLNGIYACIDEMVKLSGFKTTYSGHTNLNSLLDALWPAALAKSSNGGYWILGGQLENTHLDELSLVKAAFSRIEKFSGDVSLSSLEKEHRDDNEYYLDNHQPTAISLLKGLSSYGSEDYPNIYQLFLLTESLFYSLNRYNDNFSENFSELRNINAKIQGLCYRFFATNEIFALAWMSEKILAKVLVWNNEDLVTTWANKNNLHHDIRLDTPDPVFIFNTFRDLQTGTEWSSQKRMEILFAYIGHRFYYDHMHKNLYTLIEAHNKNKKNNKDKVDLAAIKKLCIKCKQEHEEYTKDLSSDNSRYCYLTNVQENREK